jgi:RNA-binding protein
MSTITPKQRAHLRRLAHALKPVVLVGQEGVTAAVLTSVTEAFSTRELLKLKVREASPVDARTAADQIVASLGDVHPVQTIGRTAVLYRRHPERPEIQLPPSSD